jgi:hypothetical protein
MENLENHCLEACFKPYKDLVNLQTLDSPLVLVLKRKNGARGWQPPPKGWPRVAIGPPLDLLGMARRPPPMAWGWQRANLGGHPPCPIFSFSFLFFF